MKYFPFLSLTLALTGLGRVQAQIVYGTYFQNNTTYLTAIDLSTCTACVVFEWPPTANQDVSILPDGRVVLLNSNAPEIFVYTLPDPTPTVIPMPPPAPNVRGSIVINGLMYLHSANGLYAFDPLTNQINFIGDWPPAMTGSYEFYEVGGQVYAIGMGAGPRPIWQIDLQNPGNSVFVQNTGGYVQLITSATSVNGVIYLGASPWLLSYDPVANTFEEECNLPSMGITSSLAGLTFLPAGVPAPPCICSTEAGDMQAGAFDLCGNAPVQATHNGNEVLDGNDLLRFILFSGLFTVCVPPGVGVGALVVQATSLTDAHCTCI